MQASLVTVEPKDRAEAIERWEQDLYAPDGGWEQVDRDVHQALGLNPT